MDFQMHVAQLLSMDFAATDSRTQGYQQALNLVQTIISQLEEDPTHKELIEPLAFSRLLTLVQKLAFSHPDQDPEPFFAEWCERQWASRLHLNPYDAESQLGLARSWLLRAQPSLARIEQHDNTAESTQSSSSSNGSTISPRRVRRAMADTDRIDSHDYVTARDMLRPAVDHIDLAMAVIHRERSFTGDVLEQAAETYIHYGNISHPRHNEVCYQRALHCLQLLNDMADHSMDEHLREFYEANEDYIVEDNPPWYTRIEISV